MKLIYFAWVRERTGISEEDVTLPETVETVSDLLEWLKNRDDGFAYAFENEDIIRVAIDKVHVADNVPIGSAQEIAFFPPMTGG